MAADDLYVPAYNKDQNKTFSSSAKELQIIEHLKLHVANVQRQRKAVCFTVKNQDNFKIDDSIFEQRSLNDKQTTS